jgi:hypothetical protein
LAVLSSVLVVWPFRRPLWLFGSFCCLAVSASVLAVWPFRSPLWAVWPFRLFGRFGGHFGRFGCLSVSAIWPFRLFGRFGVRFRRFSWLAVSLSVLIVWLF